MLMRRTLLGGLALPLVATRARAQVWPDRPVRLVVPYAAGGPTDTVARLLAERLSASLPQRVVVENRAGGGALIGTEAVARAPKDGSTLLFTTVVHAVHRALHGTRLTFDPTADFAPVALVGVVPQVIMVPPESPVRDVPGLLRYLRDGQHAYGSSGAGGSSHLGVELLKSMTGVRAEHVPYRGTAPAVVDLIAGRIALVMDSVATGAAQVRGGTLRGIATTGPRRSSALPDLPTVAETVPGFAATTWNAVLAPSGTPDATLAAISEAVTAALGEPALQARLTELGVEVPPAAERNIAAARQFVAAETAKWEKLIAEAGIRAS
ncbi:tripartite tricarboxylate transporter substrate binding protein [Roseomonas frigidaquae]|uniref:Tripartite tricarboxylate transporter substrate binding protein n=1 Tax=Falsiroseomonas frigidaquae TaxID=487318 RepID=A0ABX1EU38_9PROT|nr:tripartite tricarboxylate transporter substrate-binding protein [Falsiroseomonas frigidaquae]NKE44068.1 tripartite tricarboxylate transporter substrate binding protein [Falsiroseomonas frigidaquae]